MMIRKPALAILSIFVCLVLAFSGGEASAASQAVPAQPAASSGIKARLAVPAAVLAAPLPVSQVTAGFEHSCVLVNSAVKCWGSNRYGQLGSSAITIHPFPIPVSGLSGAVAYVGAGAYHTCARKVDGTVWCWGLNSLGQLGNGTTTNSAAPVQVSGLSGVTYLAAGYNYNCAVTAAQTVFCWGENTNGQLGDGTTTSTSTPVQVSGLASVLAVTGSFDHTCALISGNTVVQCWGKNLYGQLGNGTFTNALTPTPVSLPGGTIVNAVATGAQHTCALTSLNTVLCWGDGLFGQIGNGANTPKVNTPQLVSGLTNAVSISAGGYADTGHTCIVNTNGGLRCWGSNVHGQLGDGTNNNLNTPGVVFGLSTGVQAVAAGVNHTCALLVDTSVRCWGSDSSGQLGDGVNSISTTAVDVNGVSAAVTGLGTGEQNTCALAGGQVLCWGNNRKGQLGDGTSTNRPAPTPVSGISGVVTAIDSGANQTCVIADGGVQCWGGTQLTPAVVIPASSSVTGLSVANLHACAVVGGAAQCWGDNTRGQLGNGSTTSSATPVQVSGLASGVVSVAAGQWFSCALLATGEVSCWGENTNGQLGNGSTSPTPLLTPVLVSGLSNAATLAAGQDHACVITSGGAALCWGNNQQGQLGNGTQTRATSPAPVSGLSSGVTGITAGGYHTCALVSGGVKCWGFNSFGQLGNGKTIISKVPVSATGLEIGIASVVAGGVNYDEEHTCAITDQQMLKCWGGNEYGQLGDNLPIWRNVPIRVVGLTDGQDIGQNYPTGRMGSYFRIAVANFGPGEILRVTADGANMGSLTATNEGYAIFHILANTNLAGTVQIEVAGSTQNVTTSIALDAIHGLRPEEGTAPVYAINTQFFYLPIMVR